MLLQLFLSLTLAVSADPLLVSDGLEVFGTYDKNSSRWDECTQQNHTCIAENTVCVIRVLKQVLNVQDTEYEKDVD